MKNFDFIALLVFAALFGAMAVLLCRLWGGGGGGSDVAYPSSRAPQGGGWIPGGTTSKYRNGGVGATSPEVWAN